MSNVHVIFKPPYHLSTGYAYYVVLFIVQGHCVYNDYNLNFVQAYGTLQTKLLALPTLESFEKISQELPFLSRIIKFINFFPFKTVTL